MLCSYCTTAHIIVALLTAESRPYTESYSWLSVPGPKGSRISLKTALLIPVWSLSNFTIMLIMLLMLHAYRVYVSMPM